MYDSLSMFVSLPLKYPSSQLGVNESNYIYNITIMFHPKLGKYMIFQTTPSSENVGGGGNSVYWTNKDLFSLFDSL